MSTAIEQEDEAVTPTRHLAALGRADSRRRGRRCPAEIDREVLGGARPPHAWGYRAARPPWLGWSINTPELMLLDYSLPDMHGEQLLHRIEARGKPVLVRGRHRARQRERGRRDDEARGLRLRHQGGHLHAAVARGRRSGLGEGETGRTSGRNRGRAAAGARGVGTARRATHGGIGRGQSSAADRDRRTQACRGSGTTTPGRTGPRRQAEHRRRNDGGIGPRIEPAAQRDLQSRPGLQAVAGFRRQGLRRRSGGLAQPGERTGHSGRRDYPPRAAFRGQGQAVGGGRRRQRDDPRRGGVDEHRRSHGRERKRFSN